MLALTEFAALHKSLCHDFVLSVYVSAPAKNPSLRHAWRTALRAKLNRWNHALANRDKEERRQFALAREALERALTSDTEERHAAGLMAFATAAGVQRLEPLSFAVDTVVVWGRGIATAPYARALKQERPVVLAVVDGKTAHLYRYQSSRLRPLEEIRVEPLLEAPVHMGAGVGQSFHPGVRGSTGHDDAQHGWAAATERMLHRLTDRIRHHAGDDGWILIGGRTDVARKALDALPPRLRDRSGAADGISTRSSLDALGREAREGASRLRNAADLRALDALSHSHGEYGASAVGEAESYRALEGRRVAQLYISSRYARDHAEGVEGAVRSALEQGAQIEAVSGEAGERLSAMGGIAARLRYPTAHQRKPNN